MTTSRADIIRGPAVITYDSVSIFTEDDIKLDYDIQTFKMPSSIHGEADERIDNIAFKLSFKPEGFWAYRSVLCPYHTPIYGTSLGGATDKNVVIQTLAGQEITIKAGFISKMPDLTLSAGKSFWGSCEITCVGANATAWSDAAKRVAIAGNAFSDATYNTSGKVTIPYAAAWGASAPWSSIDTLDGWTISFEMGMDPVTSDREGILDYTLGAVGVMAKCTPIGVSEANLLSLMKIQGAGIARGVSLGGNKNDLVIQGATEADPKVTIKNCAPKTAGYAFGQTTLRVGEIGWVGVNTIASGALGQLFDLGVVPGA